MDIYQVYSWLVLAVFLIGGSYILVSLRFRKWLDTSRTRRKHERAHKGLVKCEDPYCDAVAVAYTPNGYFCEWHWEPMSKKELSGGGFVIWHHDLYHSIRRS